MRRMILPERVSAPGAHCSQSGLAIGPISLRPLHQLALQGLGRLGADVQGDIGVDALALDLMGRADHRGLGDLMVATRALSTSAVPMRWPETLITSSTRPVIQ